MRLSMSISEICMISLYYTIKITSVLVCAVSHSDKCISESDFFLTLDRTQYISWSDLQYVECDRHIYVVCGPDNNKLRREIRALWVADSTRDADYTSSTSQS